MRNYLLLATAIVAIHSLCGCTSKDKETLQRTNDGTETFKFDPNAVQTGTTPPSEPAQPASNPDATSTFKFNPDLVPGHRPSGQQANPDSEKNEENPK